MELIKLRILCTLGIYPMFTSSEIYGLVKTLSRADKTEEENAPKVELYRACSFCVPSVEDATTHRTISRRPV